MNAEEERKCVDMCVEIVSERAKNEGGEYDEEMLRRRLVGMFSRGESAEQVLNWARTAQFQEKKTSYRGYA